MLRQASLALEVGAGDGMSMVLQFVVLVGCTLRVDGNRTVWKFLPMVALLALANWLPGLQSQVHDIPLCD